MPRVGKHFIHSHKHEEGSLGPKKGLKAAIIGCSNCRLRPVTMIVGGLGLMLGGSAMAMLVPGAGTAAGGLVLGASVSLLVLGIRNAMINYKNAKNPTYVPAMPLTFQRQPTHFNAE